VRGAQLTRGGADQVVNVGFYHPSCDGGGVIGAPAHVLSENNYGNVRIAAGRHARQYGHFVPEGGPVLETNGMVRRLRPSGYKRWDRRRSMEIDTVGIDLGKTVFHVVGLSTAGEVVVRRKFSRRQLLGFTSNLRVRLIGMESCGGSHFLGRAQREQGHEVRLMPAQ
jgi:hypothetical protein